MNINVAAFTVSEKLSNIFYDTSLTDHIGLEETFEYVDRKKDAHES